MLLETVTLTKAVGARSLFEDLSFSIDDGEKIALIGRNGQGKTTLLKILSGEDSDFDGKLNSRRDLRVTLTKQEHSTSSGQSSLEYILESVPNFYKHQEVLQQYEQGLLPDVNQYLRSLNYFSDHGYYYVTDLILGTLADFGITKKLAHQPLATLSGGEKRFVEMTRMMYSRSDLFLIDEPTNHMDYQGKNRFISWLQSLKKGVLVVTHDRDVLKYVDKIIELKDKKLSFYKGNYDQYISQNATQTLTSVKSYTDQLNRLKEAKKRVEWGLQMRAKSKAWKIRYDHWLRDYEKIKAETVKPSFWIDQNSVESLDKKVVDSYHKFKEKNITITVHAAKEQGIELVSIRNVSLGYTNPVFSNLSFSLKTDQRIQIKGRNGAGKSTLVRTLMALAKKQAAKASIFEGEIVLEDDLRIGEYEQEINDTYLSMSLEEAIVTSYREMGVELEERKLRSLLAQYLFDPIMDARQKIKDLSGGQKARFQLIKMFINKPNLLILDEPTNHLDLPSIEELENSLAQFTGGIIYISHDTYFIEGMGGVVVEI